jgi:hypothetical protein
VIAYCPGELRFRWLEFFAITSQNRLAKLPRLEEGKFQLKDLNSGSAYVLRAMDLAITRYKSRPMGDPSEADPLD